MQQALVSIVMPVRNAEPYLEECLESIIAQTYKNWELVAVNDHSTDNSAELLRNFASKDSRIRVLKNRNKGIIPALQMAYSVSKGACITRMDADDIMASNKLELLLKILVNNGSGVVATGKVSYFSEAGIGEGYKRYEGWLNALIDEKIHWSAIYKECVIPSPCWMVSRSDFDSCGGFDLALYPEDYDLCFRFYKHGMRVVGSESILHQWRDYGERASRNDPHYADNRFLGLKLRYFLELEIKTEKNLIVWGAGKKGKVIAKFFVERKVPFLWVCDNKEKIGKDIYGCILNAVSSVNKVANAQVIIAVANVQEQQNILRQLEGKEYYVFC